MALNFGTLLIWEAALTGKKLKGGQLHRHFYRMLADLYDSMDYYTILIRRAERELHMHTKRGAWSAEVCLRVDFLNQHIKDLTAGLEKMRLQLA